jgi:hypothetical protein
VEIRGAVQIVAIVSAKQGKQSNEADEGQGGDGKNAAFGAGRSATQVPFYYVA